MHWTLIQVIGQFIEIKGLTGLLHIENDTSATGEQQILTGAWIKTIGQILEAISVSSQISETDIIKLLQEQKLAITGDLLCQLVQLMKYPEEFRYLKRNRSKRLALFHKENDLEIFFMVCGTFKFFPIISSIRSDHNHTGFQPCFFMERLDLLIN